MSEEVKNFEISIDGGEAKIPSSIERPKFIWVICALNIFYIALFQNTLRKYMFAEVNPKGPLAALCVLILVVFLIYFIKAVLRLEKIALHTSSALFLLMILFGINGALQGNVSSLLLLSIPSALCVFYLNRKSFLALSKSYREYKIYKAKYFIK